MGSDIPSEPGASVAAAGPAAAPRPRGSIVLRRAGLVLASTALAFVFGEAACRVLAHVGNQETLDVAFSTERHIEQGQRVALIDILQASPNDRIIFELKRGMRDVPFKGAPFSTNSHGFRGPEMDVAEAPGTVTIVGLGDSVMFGYGVADDRPYLALLERRLQQKYPQRQWRCVNTAVPAYSTVIEVETLRTRALPFGPDLVILGLVSNDLVLPPYMRRVDDVFDLGRSFFYEQIVEGTRWTIDRNGFDLREGRDRRLVFKADQVAGAVVDDKYLQLTGWDAFHQALRDLDGLSREHGFEVVTFTNTEDATLRRMLKAARDLGWQQVRLLPEIDAYLAEHGGGKWDPDDPKAYLASGLAVAPDDGHPSPLQHWMAAEKLLSELERGGVIARLLE
jgi:lysophospholipase L1-like esterase